LSALAILFSGTFAVLVPARERRIAAKAAAQNRLSVYSAKSLYPGHLRIEVRYRPEHLNVGLEARVRVHNSGLELLPGLKVSPAAGRYVLDDLTKQGSKEAKIRLTRDSYDLKPFTGGVLVRGPMSWDLRGEVTVEIWTDADPTMLTENKFAVSPIT